MTLWWYITKNWMKKILNQYKKNTFEKKCRNQTEFESSEYG